MSRARRVPPRTDVPSRRAALAALLLGASAIGLSPIFVRLSELPPTATAFHRTFLALPLLALWASRRPVPAAARPGDRAVLVLAGLAFAGDLGFWHWSIRFTTVANATLFANLAPVFVTAGSYLLFGQRPTRLFLAGLALALAGAAVLMGDSLSLSRRQLAGDALGVVTALFYAGYLLSVSRLRARLPAARIMATTALVTSAALLPVALASGERLVPATARGWLVLIGLAVVSHSGGQGLIAYALAYLPASFSAVALLVQPVMAALFAWAILGEPVGWRQGAGGVMVLAGIAVARRAALGTPRASG
ncbi:MAG TPA: DMT family transporter [Thermodesulfobacteriota bacterium]|nr:DMT family transporter [Thermodesulfobacteriota bacterium]